MPSAEYQAQQNSSQHTQTQLPRSTDGGTLEAIYPKDFTDLAAQSVSTTKDTPRVALMHTTEDGAMFSISSAGSDPFCPLPTGVLLLVSVPPNQKIKVDKAVRVIWL